MFGFLMAFVEPRLLQIGMGIEKSCYRAKEHGSGAWV